MRIIALGVQVFAHYLPTRLWTCYGQVGVVSCPKQFCCSVLLRCSVLSLNLATFQHPPLGSVSLISIRGICSSFPVMTDTKLPSMLPCWCSANFANYCVEESVRFNPVLSDYHDELNPFEIYLREKLFIFPFSLFLLLLHLSLYHFLPLLEEGWSC